MNYVLRADCHGKSLTPLVLQALAPAIEDVTGRGLASAVAFQPDWVGGQHIRVALDDSAEDGAVEHIAAALQHHLDIHGAGDDPSPADYERTQGALGQLTPDASPLMPNGVVTRGRFTPPRARDNEELGHIRDVFRARTLDRQYRLRRLWEQDNGDGVAELALHLMILERIDWADGINLWAMSILAHADNYRHLFESAANEAMLDGIEQRLLARLDAAGFGGGDALDDDMAQWQRSLQSQYDTHVAFWRANPELVAEWGRRDAEETPPVPVSQDRWREIASAPRRVTYRHMVNDLYDLQLTSGMTVAAKLLACHAIDRVIRRHLPETGQRIRESAMAM